MPAQRFGHRVTLLLPTPRAALDIGEEQRYRSAWNRALNAIDRSTRYCCRRRGDAGEIETWRVSAIR